MEMWSIFELIGKARFEPRLKGDVGLTCVESGEKMFQEEEIVSAKV